MDVFPAYVHFTQIRKEMGTIIKELDKNVDNLTEEKRRILQMLFHQTEAYMKVYPQLFTMETLYYLEVTRRMLRLNSMY